MKFSFDARIYKVGINPCVKVPKTITRQMIPIKGYIPVKGKIEQFNFKQTLVPVKNAPYRLYVNGPMLKGADVGVGDTVHFSLEQDLDPRSRKVSMPKYFKLRLEKNGVWENFKNLNLSRQKEILKYLGYLKTEASRERNMEKIISELKSVNVDR
jgi:hypothetical protein